MKVFAGVALLLAGTDVVQGVAFLKQKRFNKQRHFMSSRDGARPGKEYGGPVEACCGCVKARSLAKTDGQTRECGTCYTADTWQVSGADKETAEIGGERATNFKVLPYVTTPAAINTQNKITEEGECKKYASNYKSTYYQPKYWGVGARGCTVFLGGFEPQDYDENNSDQNRKMKFAGRYAPIRIGAIGEDPSIDIPPLIEVSNAAGGSSGKETKAGYEVITSSAKESINQWHWTCADGNAPQDDLSEWQNPFVEGEPPSRSLYKLCREPRGVSREDMERACEEFLNPTEEVEDADKAMTNGGRMPYPIVPW